MLKPTLFFTQLSLITRTVIMAVCFSGAALPVEAQWQRNTKWLFAGIVPSQDQWKLLDTYLQKVAESANTDFVWREDLQQMRAVLTPQQQQIFDINVTVDSVWALYSRAFIKLWNASQTTPGITLAKGTFYAWYSYYGALGDSLQNVSQTPAQMQQRWETARQTIRILLTPAQQQQLDQQLDHYAREAASLAALHTHDPKSLLAGIAPSSTQRTQLAPLQARALGAPNSVWQHTMQEIRAVLTPKQSQVYDVNVQVDSMWGKYLMAFEQIWPTITPPWNETIEAFFITTREHYGAVSDSLQTVVQTPAQIQKRWETARQALRDFLTDGERKLLDEFLK